MKQALFTCDGCGLKAAVSVRCEQPAGWLNDSVFGVSYHCCPNCKNALSKQCEDRRHELWRKGSKKP